jgi:hypothetical protein
LGNGFWSGAILENPVSDTIDVFRMSFVGTGLELAAEAVPSLVDGQPGRVQTPPDGCPISAILWQMWAFGVRVG